MNKKIAVKMTANFERNIDDIVDDIEQFLSAADLLASFDTLLEELAERVIPNLEQFPDIGRPFMQKPGKSVETCAALIALKRRLKAGTLHEYLTSDYLILYARYGDVITLLSIKHHRQMSFDFNTIWI